jgi:hypothetical protein
MAARKDVTGRDRSRPLASIPRCIAAGNILFGCDSILVRSVIDVKENVHEKKVQVPENKCLSLPDAILHSPEKSAREDVVK